MIIKSYEQSIFIYPLPSSHCRRSREQNENNMKKFIEERKRSSLTHSRQKEKLCRVHKEQTDRLNTDIERVSPSLRVFQTNGRNYLNSFIFFLTRP